MNEENYENLQVYLRIRPCLNSCNLNFLPAIPILPDKNFEMF